MIGLVAALLALPIIWAMGGKIELTDSGVYWIAAWLTISSCLTLFVASPFFMWAEQKRRADVAVSSLRRFDPERTKELRNAIKDIRSLALSGRGSADTAEILNRFNNVAEDFVGVADLNADLSTLDNRIVRILTIRDHMQRSRPDDDFDQSVLTGLINDALAASDNILRSTDGVILS